MFNIKLFNSPQYWSGAMLVWLASFFTIPHTQTVINLTYLILLIPTLLTIKPSEIAHFFSDFQAKVLVVWMLILIFAAFRAGSPLSQLKFSLIVLCFYLAIFRLPKFDISLIHRAAWVIFCVILAYIAVNLLLKYRAGLWAPWTRLTELFAFEDNPIHVANHMTACLAVLSCTSLYLRRYGNLLLAHTLTLFCSLVILQSRGMLPAWCFIVLLTAVFTLKNRGDVASKTWVYTLLIPIAILAILMSNPLGQEILSRADSHRFEIWQGYIRETLKCGALLGCGLDDKIHYITHDGISIPHAHNIFVANFSRAGLIGLIPLLVLVLGNIWYGLKNNVWAGWMLSAGALVLMFTGSALIRSPNDRWILIHLPIAYLIKIRAEQKLSGKISS